MDLSVISIYNQSDVCGFALEHMKRETLYENPDDNLARIRDVQNMSEVLSRQLHPCNSICKQYQNYCISSYIVSRRDPDRGMDEELCQTQDLPDHGQPSQFFNCDDYLFALVAYRGSMY